MARATQIKNIRVTNSIGQPVLGATVELKRGALSITMTELGNGYYKTDAVSPGQYSVYVGSVDTGQTVAVGAGELDRPDYEANPNSFMVTDGLGAPEWVPNIDWSVINNTPTTIAGYGITDALSLTTGDARYLQLTGGTLTGPLTQESGF